MKKTELEYQLSYLKDLVDIPSTSKDFSGVNQVQTFLAEKLKSLGFKTNFFENPLNVSGNSLVAIYPGKTEELMTIVGHADTVGRHTDNFNFHYDEETDKVTGPGIADDKGGLTVALRGVEKYLKDNPEPYYSIAFVSSANEEEGSIGFHDLFREIGLKTKYALGMEPALQCGSIISSRNGNRWYKIQIEGIASHSGRFGEPNINAAHELAIKIGKLHRLNDEENRVRVNVGTFSGGNGTFNTICEKAEALLDTRFPCFQRRDQLHQDILTVLENHELECVFSGKKPKLSYSIQDDCPPLNYNPNHHPLIANYLEFIRSEETYCHVLPNKIVDKHSGGASDINYFSTPKNFVLDGLGPIGGKLHTRQEYLLAHSLVSRAEALSLFLKQINHSNIIKDENAVVQEEHQLMFL